MTPLEFYLSKEAEKERFILGMKKDGAQVRGCSPNEEIMVKYEGRHDELVDAWVVLGIFRMITALFRRFSRPDPTVMYILNEDEGKGLGFRQKDE